jgi:serine/threonine protein phosphatase PrpC
MKVSLSGCTHIGGKDENQDTFFHKIQTDGSAYLGVFDGHGEFGTEVAEAVRDHFKVSTLDSGFEMAEEVSKQAILAGALKKGLAVREHADKMLYHGDWMGLPKPVRGGTTAAVVQIKDGLLRVGHVGDSEVMVIHESGKFTILTNDHSCTSIPEWERIQKEATVIPKVNFAFMGAWERPVFVRHGASWKINPQGGVRVCNLRKDWSAYLVGHEESLNMARSIGDFSLKKHGVCAQPDFLEHRLEPGRNIVLTASDGLYDNFTYEDLRDLVLKGVVDSSDTKIVTRRLLDRVMDIGFKNFGKKGQDNTTLVLAVVEVLEPTESFLARTAARRGRM